MRLIRRRRDVAGSRPGTLFVPTDALAPKIRLIDYSAVELQMLDVNDLETLESLVNRPTVTWSTNTRSSLVSRASTPPFSTNACCGRQTFPLWAQQRSNSSHLPANG